MSRDVTCGIVSSPVSRSIATDDISAFIRARAIGLSFTSTTSTTPEPFSRWAVESHRFEVAALRRVELDRDDPLAGGELARELRPGLGVGLVREQLALAADAGSGGAAVILDRCADRLDLDRRASRSSRRRSAPLARARARRTPRSTRVSRADR